MFHRFSWLRFDILFTCLQIIPIFAYGAVLLPVPFTSQAPFGVWAQPYQDFCEEASVVMAAHFVWGYPLSRDLADLEMKLIRQYEDLVFKDYKNTSAEETAMILKTLYGFKNVQVKETASAEDIKRELLSGKVVLAPAAGRLLGNPNFVPPGPLYHMVVVRGFDDVAGVFIVNDPGTKNGNGFRYRQTAFFNAIHDWNNGNVLGGKKMIVVVGK